MNEVGRGGGGGGSPEPPAPRRAGGPAGGATDPAGGSVPVCIDDAVSAWALALAGDRLELDAPEAYAPGQPVRLRFDLPAGAGQPEVAARARGSTRTPEGRFSVSLRLVDLRREVRRALVEALSPGA
ncbi:MAG TPA: hypothetical protein RMF84_12265 [Polyangiaceae bacterium LLY-WYZ-14_1]|nr:hypothetical protein [Polyangiaceae bacterium LLY-WYZ-14_1]